MENEAGLSTFCDRNTHHPEELHHIGTCVLLPAYARSIPSQ